MDSWKSVREKEDFFTLIENSAEKPQIIFKDSTTCGISAHARYKLELGFELIEDKADFHYLDLLSFRSISNLIAQELKVTHQSPQIILVKNKQVIYTSSHHAIDPAVIARHLS
ncbi:MAG TPA: bacillithiol system redox-active protein YtxJ [Niastella sp.]